MVTVRVPPAANFCSRLNLPSLVSSTPSAYQLTEGQTFLAFLLTILALLSFLPGFLLAAAITRRLFRRI